ncbi:hypothetical protein ACPJHQ_19430 [Rossellomorea sp. H39__3]
MGTTEGYLGFAAEKGAVFQDARVSGLEGNLEGWTPDRGEWLPHLQGVMGTSDGEDNAFRMATTVGNDFILEGDVTIQDDSSYGTAGLIFRSDGASGYMLQVDPNLDRIRLLDLKGDRTIGESKRELSRDRPTMSNSTSWGHRSRYMWTDMKNLQSMLSIPLIPKGDSG